MDSEKITPEILGRLEAAVGKENVKAGKKSCCSDSECSTGVTVCPSSTEQVAAVMRVATEEGLCTCPCHGDVAFDLSANMNKVVKVDTVNFCVKAQAGASMEEVVKACDEAGYIVADRTTCEGATVGCLVFSNGVDIGTYRFGPVRENVMNLSLIHI